MSVLVNLLPDTRQAKQRERHRRQLATGIAVVVWIVAGGVVGLLALYSTSQKLIINNYNNDIQQKRSDLTKVEGLTEALTAQQQLSSLPLLYQQRVYLTKFFEAYTMSNPAQVSLSSLTLDSGNVLTISGSAVSYAAIAKLAKALEQSNVTVGKDAAPANTPYFTSVSVQSAGKSNNAVSFSISAIVAAGVTGGK